MPLRGLDAWEGDLEGSFCIVGVAAMVRNDEFKPTIDLSFCRCML